MSKSLLCFAVFVTASNFTTVLILCVVLGFFRSYIQTCTPMVLLEAYSDQFVSAISLLMMIRGVVSISIGLIAGKIFYNSFYIFCVSFDASYNCFQVLLED